MLRKTIVLILSAFLLFSCSKFKKNKEVIYDAEKDEEMAILIYDEALKALKEGDAFYARKKFKEVESLLPQTRWAAKASILAAYEDYTRNSYADSVFALERHITSYPVDKYIPYAHYLIAICYYEQILDEKKDLDPLIKAKEKFEFIMKNYPDTDYGTDARFKIDLIIDQLAAKEMSIARYYMKTEKWIPALNRLKIIVNDYDTTVFVKEAASILGYNYKSGEWYKKSYKVFNKKYKLKKIKKEKESGLIMKKIKGLFE